jgi:site-specific recombinase XerD
MDLEPIDPETALELYLAAKESEYAASTVRSHRSRLDFFVRWCAEHGIDNLNDLTGRQLHQFRLWRREVGDLSPATEKSQLDTLHVFVRWLGTVDGCDPDLHLKVRSPGLTPAQNTRDVMLEAERAEPTLAYLERFHYASRRHVVLALLWHTMLRMGAARAIDLRDYHPDEGCVEIRHRPETGTPLKNQETGERLVALSDDLCQLLDDWIAERRPDTVDDHGRHPLLATAQGRLSGSGLRSHVYRFTRPCQVGEECPHDRDPEECEAVGRDQASKCPSSVSPHAIRRGAITNHLNSDVPENVVGDRANVSKDVLDQHYDQRTERERMEQRRGYLDNI